MRQQKPKDQFLKSIKRHRSTRGKRSHKGNLKEASRIPKQALLKAKEERFSGRRHLSTKSKEGESKRPLDVDN